ncbi:MAG: HEAT repeat domain-containing protein [Synechococcus sp.]
MNPSLLGGAFALLLVLFWWGGRSRPRVLGSRDASAVAALNRQQIERLAQLDTLGSSEPEGGSDPPEDPDPTVSGGSLLPPPQVPQRARWRRQRLRWLEAQLRGGPLQRRGALQELQRWSDPAALPLLRRSLRDPDPAVVQLAALGLERFRGRARLGPQPLTPSTTGALAASRPRNVARTR